MNVLEVRNALALTQPQFGFLVGVSSTTVSNWERGVSQPSPWRAELISNIGIGVQTDRYAPADWRVLLNLKGPIGTLNVLLNESWEVRRRGVKRRADEQPAVRSAAAPPGAERRESRGSESCRPVASRFAEVRAKCER